MIRRTWTQVFVDTIRTVCVTGARQVNNKRFRIVKHLTTANNTDMLLVFVFVYVLQSLFFYKSRQNLEVELKTRLEKFQRREFYRYECSIDFKFFELTEEQADLATVEEIFAQLRDEHFNDKIRTGTIVDISGGGIRFNSDTELKSGDHILAVAHLANERMNQEFHIVGSVISCEKKEQVTEKKYVSRVKFMIKDDRVREDIIRYIFEEERLTRQKDKR